MSGQFGLFGGMQAFPDGRIVIPLVEAEPLVLWQRWAPVQQFAAIRDAITWEQHLIAVPTGQRVPAPRLESFYADDLDRSYRYSGESYRPRNLAEHQGLDVIRELVSKTTRVPWNAVFCNLYRTGTDSIGWHADDERESLGDPRQVQIASLSFGVRRPFCIKHRESDESVTVDLGEGDLLLMGRGTQSRYLHSVPKRPRITDQRMNLTFRLLVP